MTDREADASGSEPDMKTSSSLAGRVTALFWVLVVLAAAVAAVMTMLPLPAWAVFVFVLAVMLPVAGFVRLVPPDLGFVGRGDDHHRTGHRGALLAVDHLERAADRLTAGLGGRRSGGEERQQHSGRRRCEESCAGGHECRESRGTTPTLGAIDGRRRRRLPSRPCPTRPIIASRPPA